ncbi:hypothetical protein CHL76_01385 [Marinococcus halophilus]|uniref:SpoIID/LytB domain protein n=1 Tax=Marinococcus halophilus TaxID=1371 RepID=A0A510Y352_MARHA|nr:peptidoglycan-binding protein [Marinococcus halophilus]OZT81774.1 hypothetical protein CHL76_01385 [Marinococcus halophilus]GEK57734.1 hypothetical protein MHA01_06390 [Marinococcus halophilus]
MVSSKKIIFFSSFIVSISLGSFATADTAQANEENNSNELYMAEGTEASEVKELEEALIVLGYPLQEADTLFDSDTSIHISDYQEQNSFEVTGEADRELLESILDDVKSIEENEASINTDSEEDVPEDTSTDHSSSGDTSEEENSELKDDIDESSIESSSEEGENQELEEESAVENSEEDSQKTEIKDQSGSDNKEEETTQEKQSTEDTIQENTSTSADENSGSENKDTEKQDKAEPQKERTFVLSARTFSSANIMKETSSTILKDGVTSPAAQAMKENLYTLGYLDIADPNERFGPQTEAAVKAFQRDQGLVVDGVAGPNTLAKLNEVLKQNDTTAKKNDKPISTDTVLKDGVNSPAAQVMKQNLYTLGYLDIADPNERFGPQTEAAVKAFQRDQGLVVDGVAGPNTLAKLSEVLKKNDTSDKKETDKVSTETVLKDGVTSPAAQVMKQNLYTLGYLDIADPNERFGPKTEAAVKAFQRDQGLVVDGVAGPNTLAKLNEVLKQNNTAVDKDEKPVSTNTVLKDGVRSPAAKAVKQDLYTLGYLDIAEPNEHFGPKTEAAVKAFQREHNLYVDGIAGPKTLAKLREVMQNPPADDASRDDSSSRVLKDGVTSPAAQAMKADLYTLGYLDIADPNERFGPKTEAAVKAFQRDQGLVVDGVAGPNTLAEITKVLNQNNTADKTDEKPISTATVLKDGVRSPEAKAVKEDLYTLGYLDIDEPNEHFGPKTEAAVKAFQREHNLYVDGIAGPKTLAKLREVMKNPPADDASDDSSSEDSSSTVLKDGVRSAEAKAMKQDLYTLGYLDIDEPNEHFGPQTEAAVKAFQREHNLYVDGIAGPKTLAKLREVMQNPPADDASDDSSSEDSSSTVLKDGVRSPEAKAVKQDLYTLGYLDIAEPNEHFGPKTEAAVKAFQRDYGLTVNGVADPATLSKLKEALEGEMNASIPSPFTSVLGQGDSGDSVITLKQYLEAAGYSTNTSSTYDQLTADQVKAYQSANGLSASGAANAQTLSSLVEKRGTTYVFSGKQRFGHGVGMTQWGAYGMAQQGYGYEKILKHYYTGIDVVNSDSYKNKTMRVLLGDTQKNSADIESSSAYSIVTTNGDTLFENVSGSTTITYGSGGNGTYTVTNNGSEKTTTDPIYAVSSTSGTIEYNDVTYKGEIHFPKSLVEGKYTSSWVMDVVNHVSIDTYLEGVVPYEMYTSWNEPDAYKAQAVAARSYAMTKMKTSGTFDVYNDTRSQVYHGVPTGSHNSPTILNAIQSTSGQAIHYNGRLVEGVYSASASGHTVDAADVWGNNVGYLIGVPDPYDPSRYNQVSWTESFSLKELSAVDYFKNESKGEVLALQPTMKNERLQSIKVIMEKGTITLTGDQFRSAVDSNAMKSNILSIEEIN